MLKLTYLPAFVQVVFRGMPGVWKSRHRLLLCWLIFMQAVYSGPKKLKEQARWTPTLITEWRFRRLLKATYWSIHVLVSWLADEAIKSFPAPEDGVLYLIGDGSEKPKRGKKHPVAQKGRKSNKHPYFFGIRFVMLMVAWDVYRIPVGFRLILPKTHPAYQTENELFRQMVVQFVPPRHRFLEHLSPIHIRLGDGGISPDHFDLRVRNFFLFCPIRRTSPSLFLWRSTSI